MKTVLLVVGTRPEAIKLAPVIRELKLQPDRFITRVCATAQHRDMLDQALALFGIQPDYDLDLMRHAQSPSALAGAALQRLETVIEDADPDWVLVQGDTVTAFSGAMAAFLAGRRIAHVEAGLRTHDLRQPFPEEGLRRLIADIADLHFAPTPTARANLVSEGVPEERIVVTGNPVVDAVRAVAAMVEGRFHHSPVPLEEGKRLVLATVHRRESFGEPLRHICSAVAEIAERYSDSVQIVWPVHPNPNVQRAVRTWLNGRQGIRLTPPLDYAAFIWLLKRAHVVLTDSGGVQEEAPCVGTPVVVLRPKTERPEGVEAGAAILAGTDSRNIVKTVAGLLDHPDRHRRAVEQASLYGDGNAARRIVEALLAAGIPGARTLRGARGQVASESGECLRA